MKYLLPIMALPLATPALAHSGAHLHPHGAETWLTAVAVLGAAAYAGWRMYGGGRK